MLVVFSLRLVKLPPHLRPSRELVLRADSGQLSLEPDDLASQPRRLSGVLARRRHDLAVDEP